MRDNRARVRLRVVPRLVLPILDSNPRLFHRFPQVLNLEPKLLPVVLAKGEPGVGDLLLAAQVVD